MVVRMGEGEWGVWCVDEGEVGAEGGGQDEEMRRRIV